MSATESPAQPAALPAPVNLADVELRFGDWGPGYLAQHDDAFLGTVVLRPGDVFANHLHEHHEESFLVVEGEVELWRDRRERLVLTPGDLARCTAGVEHCLRGLGAAPARLFFVKAPGVDGDKVDVPWTPPTLSGPTTTSTSENAKDDHR